jgi:hypothetical protein
MMFSEARTVVLAPLLLGGPAVAERLIRGNYVDGLELAGASAVATLVLAATYALAHYLFRFLGSDR